MPLQLDVKRGLVARSDRVKCVDMHPNDPWMLVALYNGNVNIWNVETLQCVKNFEVCDLPVRAAKFVTRKNWIVTGSDDMMVRVYNYNTHERVQQFEAHSDYVRSIVVHPVQPFILTSSDDMVIKLWNWEQKWACQQIFEGHSHYVMQIVINPKDNNTFASASLDRTVKVWQLGSPQANFSLEGHQRGVNCVDYSHGGDKPYLISGADDCMVKIWDYQNKTCVQTIEGHSQNVSAVLFHPSLPIILTGSEDCTVKIWHANTYRQQDTMNYGLDRAWCLAAQKGCNNICIGYDEGGVMVKLGREEPAMSMDISGKMVFARHSEMQQANLKATADATSDIQDGERLPLAVKDMGSCDIYPQTIQHNPNGRFVVVCGDGEYIIYTAMALRNKAFGSAHEFVWGLDSSEYAIRENNYTIKLFKNFKEKTTFKPDFGCESMYGGQLLGCGSTTTGLAFYDWETQELVRRIEIQPKQVFWSESGLYVAIATKDNYFVLKYDADAVVKARETKQGLTDDGIEDAFELLDEVSEVVRTGKWVGDCFIYTSSVNRLNYYVGGEIVTVAHLDRNLYLLGYIAKDNRVYLGDKELSVVSYELHLSVLDYQTAVMRRDFETADKILPAVPVNHRTRVAQFLEKQGFREQALQVTQDPDHKFSIALSLSNLPVCVQLAEQLNSEQKWMVCGELAQQQNDLATARMCLLHAKDYAGLLLQATSAGNAKLVQEVGQLATNEGRNNVGFLSLFISGRLKECLQLLIDTNRIPEAAFFARSYLPSEIPRVLKLWKKAAGETVGPSLADPKTYDNLFPGIKDALKAEQYMAQVSAAGVAIPASQYSSLPLNTDRNVLEEVAEAEAEGTFTVDGELGFMSDEEEEGEDGGAKDKNNDDDEEFNDAFDEPLQTQPPAPQSVAPQEPPPVQTNVTAAQQQPAAPPTRVIPRPALDEDDDDWPQRPPVDAGPLPQGGGVDLEQIERELEFDLENVHIEDDVNLQDEELLAD